MKYFNYRFNFDKWLGKQTGNGNVKYIKFGNDEELRPTSRKLIYFFFNYAIQVKSNLRYFGS